MNRIDKTSSMASIVEAIGGDYGTATLKNGIRFRFQGGLFRFEGFFSGSEDVIEIPNIPTRIVVMFSNEEGCFGTIAEPGAGFVRVPEKIKGGMFSVFSTGILNN